MCITDPYTAMLVLHAQVMAAMQNPMAAMNSTNPKVQKLMAKLMASFGRGKPQ